MTSDFLKIEPFCALTPTKEWVEKIHCVPYDVVDTQEARQLARDNPYSLLHVDRAEIDLASDTNPYSDAVYAKARQNFLWLQKQGVLTSQSSPSFFIYQQKMGAHIQTGVVALCKVIDYETGRIKKHEKTRPDKEDDRMRLINTLGAQTGPILLTYRDVDEVSQLVENYKRNEPLYQVVAPDGVQHIIWRVEIQRELTEAFKKVPCVYIADGHHRAASAARVANLRKNQPDAQKILSVLFPASHLQILSYNRLVLDLNGLSHEIFLEKIKEHFNLQKSHQDQPDRPQRIHMYLPGQWYELESKSEKGRSVVSSLDVAVLQDKLLAPLLGIEDPRKSSRIEFVGGIRGTQFLVDKVDQGQAAVAFSMYPTTVDQMMAVADMGETMPPKSTWFEPKLRSGFFIYVFEDSA